MKDKNNYQELRSLLISKILFCNLSLKPSKSNLIKKSDEELVNLLFQNAIIKERELWREDIIKQISQFEPETEGKYINSGTNLLKTLINVVQKHKN